MLLTVVGSTPIAGGAAPPRPLRPPPRSCLVFLLRPRPPPPSYVGGDGPYAGRATAGMYAGIGGAGMVGHPFAAGRACDISASCCCIALRAALSCRVSAIKSDTKSFVACVAALLERCI